MSTEHLMHLRSHTELQNWLNWTRLLPICCLFTRNIDSDLILLPPLLQYRRCGLYDYLPNNFTAINQISMLHSDLLSSESSESYKALIQSTLLAPALKQGQTWLCTSREEALSLAIQLACTHATAMSIASCPQKSVVMGGDCLVDCDHIIPYPKALESNLSASQIGLNKTIARNNTTKALDAVNLLVNKSGGIGAFLTESIPSCSGHMILEDGALTSIYKTVRARGGCCIHDETFTSFGRLESLYDFRRLSVVPDVVLFGGPIAGDAAKLVSVIASADVAASFARSGLSHPQRNLDCSLAKTTLTKLLTNDVQFDIKRVGDHLRRRLNDLVKENPSMLAGVRGQGLSVALLFDGIDGPDPKLAQFACNRVGFKFGKIAELDGAPNKHCLKICTQLIFSNANVESLYRELSSALAAGRVMSYGGDNDNY